MQDASSLLSDIQARLVVGQQAPKAFPLPVITPATQVGVSVPLYSLWSLILMCDCLSCCTATHSVLHPSQDQALARLRGSHSCVGLQSGTPKMMATLSVTRILITQEILWLCVHLPSGGPGILLASGHAHRRGGHPPAGPRAGSGMLGPLQEGEMCTSDPEACKVELQVAAVLRLCCTWCQLHQILLAREPLTTSSMPTGTCRYAS